MTEPILELKNINKTYSNGVEKISILQKFDLKLQSGEVVAITGASGSGKTTLLQIAGLLDEPDNGEIFIDSQKINVKNSNALDKIRNEKIGFVFQYHHLLQNFTVAENIMMPSLINNKIDENKVDELLVEMKLSNRKHYHTSELSGGQRQRVAIARALCNNPKILIADEPSGNLDSETAKSIFSFLLKLAKDKNMACIMATHNLEFAKKTDRVITLQ